MRGFLLALVALLAACDTPDPLDPSNPFDPAFTQGRVPTAPTNLAVSETTPTSITLTWTDNSSFETAYHVVEIVPVVGAPDRERIVAELPPNASSFVIEDLRDVAPHRYVVRAITSPIPPADAPDAVSDVVEVQYPPLLQAGLDTSRDLSFVDLLVSGDGRTVFVYAPLTQDTRAIEIYDVRSGRRLAQATVPAFRPSGEPDRPFPVSEDRMGIAGTRDNAETNRTESVVYIVSRAGDVETRVLAQGDDCSRFVADPTGMVIGGFCFPQIESQPETWHAWSLATGAQVATLRQGDRAHAEALLSITETQALFATGRGLELVRVSDGGVVWQQALYPSWARFVDGQQNVIAGLFDGQRSVVRTLSAATGARLDEWADPLRGEILAARGTRAVYLTDMSPSIGGFEGVVVDIEDPSRRRVLSGVAGSVLAAHFTDQTVLTVGRSRRVFEWDFSRSWEVVPAPGG